MRRLLISTLLLILAVVHVFLLDRVVTAWSSLTQNEESSFVMPAPLLKITSLGFDGLVSDVLFLKGLMFIGSSLEQKGTIRVKPSEWQWFLAIMNRAADLDPYFQDPYYLGNANLTWGAGMINEANLFLEKGRQARTWDPQIPFYLGFNNFFFLKDNGKASDYLMEASRKPGADPVYARLAVNLAFKGNRTENAIGFLVELIRKTEDRSLRKRYETRLSAFNAVMFLEKAVERYRAKFNRSPKALSDLVTSGVIANMPEDPYGGTFYMEKNGAVRSTNDGKWFLR
jgi:hypothetical protein